ncbi:MAG: oxidoreductase [Nevskia sp.]|nr:oxidoreductase [Nevskia sp.]
MRSADWYFDFTSPFAYFASLRLDEMASKTALRVHPILFAGLLNHWGQKGPAEIAGKREWTYRWCVWFAQQHGIPFKAPASHPFNPVSYLRLAIAADCTPLALHTIFEAIWTTGADATDPTLVVELAQRLQIDPAQLAEQRLKDALRSETDQAIARGVFGVPTLAIDGELFWGADAIDFALACYADPTLLDSDEMRRVKNLPVGVARKLS